MIGSVLIRGEYDKIGEPVSRALPAVLPPMPAGAPNNRLGFAQWLVNGEHPLTAEVIGFRNGRTMMMMLGDTVMLRRGVLYRIAGELGATLERQGAELVPVLLPLRPVARAARADSVCVSWIWRPASTTLAAFTYRHSLDIDASGYRLAFGSTTGSLWITEDQGDCNDCDVNANPGAYDVPGNKVDEDCNNTADDALLDCDTSITDVADDANGLAVRRELVLGLAIVALVVLFPGGIVGFLRRRSERSRP